MAQREYSTHARARARRTAVQALYQWEMTHLPMESIIDEFRTDRSELKKADKAYFREVLMGISEKKVEVEGRLAEFLDREVRDLDPVERAILSLAMYELLYRPDLPWRVVVNESIELGKMFGAEQSHRYINGVLDAAAHSIRRAEITGA